MITWMQRHKKYLIITIWISTIAFVGAGFVGWGQYSYGDKAGAVAKVGNIEIKMGDLQKTYSRLYSQYAQIFQGNFDEEKAKQFGLKQQALNELTQQALILNFAKDYDLQISDKELLDELTTQKVFFKDGVFNRNIYKTTLSRNNLTMNEYESDVKKQLLIQKVLKLFPTPANKNEEKILTTIMDIADKINYKILTKSMVKIDINDKKLKTFWETRKNEFKTEISYEIEFIKNKTLSKKYDEAKINSYYADNKTHFKDNDGKILSLNKAKNAVVAELDAKRAKKSALKTYIAYKKNQLTKDIVLEKSTITASTNPFTDNVLEKISSLSVVSPYLKPLLINGNYYIFKLLKVLPAKTKTFEKAKEAIIPIYREEKTKEKLIELANNSVKKFIGINTDFITNEDTKKLKKLSANEANEFLQKLFTTTKKSGYVQLKDGKIVLYNILEQKLLTKNQNLDTIKDTITKLKSGIFNEGLIKNLQQKYKTEIFIEGL